MLWSWSSPQCRGTVRQGNVRAVETPARKQLADEAWTMPEEPQPTPHLCRVPYGAQAATVWQFAWLFMWKEFTGRA